MTIEEADASCVHCADAGVAAVVCKRIGTRYVCDVRFAPQRLTMIISTALTSNDGKEEEHDGVEEAETEGQGILVDHCRDDKDGQHGSCSEFPVGQLQGSGQERRGRGLKSKLRGQRGICASGLTRGPPLRTHFKRADRRIPLLFECRGRRETALTQRKSR